MLPPPLSHAAVLHQPKIISTYMYLRRLRHSYHLMHYTSAVYLRPLRHACYLQQLHPYQIKGSLGMHRSVVLWRCRISRRAWVPGRHLLIRLLPCLMLAPFGIVAGCHLVPFRGFGSIIPVIECTMYGVYSVSSTSPTFVPLNALHLYSVSSTSLTCMLFTTITLQYSTFVGRLSIWP